MKNQINNKLNIENLIKIEKGEMPNIYLCDECKAYLIKIGRTNTNEYCCDHHGHKR